MTLRISYFGALTLAAFLAFATEMAAVDIAPAGAPLTFADGRTLEDERFREAKVLFDRGLYDEALVIFRDIAVSEGNVLAEGWYVLTATHLQIPGYEKLVEAYAASAQTSSLVPRIRYRYALNLFDAKDFSGASEQFSLLSRHNLYRSEVPEFLFKRAYCDFELRYFDRAKLRFKDLAHRAQSDYTAPAQYAIGYICYEQEEFSEALEWLLLASEDSRFTEMASFYIFECRFMLKEYERVRSEGPALMAKVSDEKKPYVARFISEACLVLGDNENAVKYFELGRSSLSPVTRSDFFYAGSVLYAVKDYQGAIENFSMMSERRDSIGQIANYNLAYSYIKTGNKVAAMGAFKEAAAVNFDPKIKEDAFFNYAKLSFDLNTDSSVFYDYLEAYKDRGKSEQIYSYIALAALYNRDYAGAIEAYDQIDELDPDMKSNYMKANYLRANQLIKAGSYRAATECLRATAYYSDRRDYINQMSRYWLGEAYYHSGQYEQAVSVFTDLYNTSSLYGQPESLLVPLNIAYSRLQMENYPVAAEWFSTYLSQGTAVYRKEALTRYGDCLFMQQKYSEAIPSYENVLKDYFNADDVYPYYQAALAYGLTGKNSKKIELLSNVEKASPAATYYPEAMYEYGRALVLGGNSAKAISVFSALSANVRDSSYVVRSYIELGMIYRNRSENTKALEYYKKVVQEMPQTEYADAALLAIESVYKSQNTPEEYLAYIESIGRSSLKTEAEREMMIYNAAEQLFIAENYAKAQTSLNSYLEKYPHGVKVADAQYYIAECHRMAGQLETACDYYLKSLSGTGCSFREQASMTYAELNYALQNYPAAFDAYASIYSATKVAEYRTRALAGLMRAAYQARMYEEAIKYAGIQSLKEGADPGLVREAMYIEAKSLLATSERDRAMNILARLAEDPKDAMGAEAAYLRIQDSYDRGAFEEVEGRVYAFSDSGTTQNYWLAKSFIVLGDAFVELDNVEQAKATFESVAEGYSPESEQDDVIQTVRMRLDKLSELMGGTASAR